jgi:hypothetical protein
MKRKFKKLAADFKKGVKATSKFVEEYGPKVHRYLKRTSTSAMNIAAVHPQRREDLTVNLRPIPGKRRTAKLRRIKGKGDYLDFT